MIGHNPVTLPMLIITSGLPLFRSIDYHILHACTGLLSSYGFLNLLANAFGNNPLLRGSPILFILSIAFFSTKDHAIRGLMISGIIAACIATSTSNILQYCFASHIRPFLDPNLHLNAFNPNEREAWDRLYSFPSDTATLYFSLAFVAFFVNRRAGYIAILWSLFTVGFIRIALGWHYPSDIMGSFILGWFCVYFLIIFEKKLNVFRRISENTLLPHHAIDAMFCIFLADAYNLFPGIRSLIHGLHHQLAIWWKP